VLYVWFSTLSISSLLDGQAGYLLSVPFYIA
jgi:hypothetical protein